MLVSLLIRKFMIEVKDLCSKLFSLFQQSYRCPSSLYYGDKQLSLKIGFQQRDPLGPSCLCIRIMRMTQSLSPLLNGWYLHGGTIGGK